MENYSLDKYLSFNEYIVIPIIVIISIPVLLYLIQKFLNNNVLPVVTTTGNNISESQLTKSTKKKKGQQPVSENNFEADKQTTGDLLEAQTLSDDENSSNNMKPNGVVEVSQPINSEIPHIKKKKSSNKRSKHKDLAVAVDFTHVVMHDDEDFDNDNWNVVGQPKVTKPQKIFATTNNEIVKEVVIKEEALVVQNIIEPKTLNSTIMKPNKNVEHAEMPSQHKPAVKHVVEPLPEKENQELETSKLAIKQLAEQNAKLRNEISGLKSSSTNEQNHLRNIDILTKELNVKLRELESLKSEMKKGLGDYEARFLDQERRHEEQDKRWQQHLEKEKTNCQQLGIMIANGQAEDMEKEETITNLRNAINQNKNTQSQITDSLKDSESKVWGLQEELYQLTSEIDLQRQKNHELSSKSDETHTSLDNELKNAKEVNRNLMESLHVQEALVKATKQELHAISLMRDSREQSVKDVAHVKEVNRNLMESLQVQEGLVRENNKALEGVRLERMALEKEVEDDKRGMANELNVIRHENNNLKLEVKQLKEQTTRLCGDIDEKDSKLVEATARLQETDTSMAAIYETTIKLTEDYEATKRECDRLRNDKEKVQLRTDLEQTKHSSNELNEKVSVLKKEMERMQSDCELGNAENCTLRNTIIEKEEKLRVILTDIEKKVEEETSRLREETSALSNSKESLEEELTRAKDLIATNSHNSKTIESLNLRISELEAANSELHQKRQLENDEELNKIRLESDKYRLLLCEAQSFVEITKGENTELTETVTKLTNESNADKKQHESLINAEREKGKELQQNQLSLERELADVKQKIIAVNERNTILEMMSGAAATTASVEEDGSVDIHPEHIVKKESVGELEEGTDNGDQPANGLETHNKNEHISNHA